MPHFSLSLNGIALFGAAMAIVVAWQADRTARHGGAFYDAEVYGMTAVQHRRISVTAMSVGLIFLGCSAVPTLPFTPCVAFETVAVILYLASFARGASYEEEE